VNNADMMRAFPRALKPPTHRPNLRQVVRGRVGGTHFPGPPEQLIRLSWSNSPAQVLGRQEDFSRILHPRSLPAFLPQPNARLCSLSQRQASAGKVPPRGGSPPPRNQLLPRHRPQAQRCTDNFFTTAVNNRGSQGKPANPLK